MVKPTLDAALHDPVHLQLTLDSWQDLGPMGDVSLMAIVTLEGLVCRVARPADGWAPQDGDPVHIFGVQQQGREFTGQLRGVAIGDRCLFYETAAEWDARKAEEHTQHLAARQAAFAHARDTLDTRTAQLPDVFRRRIQRFRDGHPEFRWRYEAFELLCCEQAVLVAEALRADVFTLTMQPSRPTDLDPAEEILGAFRHLPVTAQIAKVPGFFKDHSVETYNTTLTLAYHYLTVPERVVTEHGAGVHAVGCPAYGCTHGPTVHLAE